MAKRRMIGKVTPPNRPRRGIATPLSLRKHGMASPYHSVPMPAVLSGRINAIPRFESWHPRQAQPSLTGDVLRFAKRPRFRGLAAKSLVSEELWASCAKRRESRVESLLEDFSISEIWEWERPETGCVSAETGSRDRRAEATGGIEWLDLDTLLLSSALGEGMATDSGYARTVSLHFVPGAVSRSAGACARVEHGAQDAPSKNGSALGPEAHQSRTLPCYFHRAKMAEKLPMVVFLRGKSDGENSCGGYRGRHLRSFEPDA
jgi:hypothetical protein